MSVLLTKSFNQYTTIGYSNDIGSVGSAEKISFNVSVIDLLNFGGLIWCEVEMMSTNVNIKYPLIPSQRDMPARSITIDTVETFDKLKFHCSCRAAVVDVKTFK